MTVGVAGAAPSSCDSHALHVLWVPNIVSDLVKLLPCPHSSLLFLLLPVGGKKVSTHMCVCVCGQGVPQAGELYNVLAMPKERRRRCAVRLICYKLVVPLRRGVVPLQWRGGGVKE